MNNQPSFSPDKLTNKPISRRVLLGLVAAAGLEFATSQALHAKQPEEPALDDIQDPFEGATPDGQYDTLDTPTPEQDPSAPSPLGSAETFRAIAHEGGDEALLQAFQISKEEAGTPSDFAKALAGRLEDWITAGCTPSEAADFTGEPLSDYQAYVDDMYGVVAATALGGDAAMTETDGDIRKSELYRQVTDLKNKVLEQYMETIRSGEAADMAVTMEALSEEMTAQDAHNHLFYMTVNLEYSNTRDEADPVVMQASFNLELHVAGPNYQLILVDGEFEPTE